MAIGTENLKPFKTFFGTTLKPKTISWISKAFQFGIKRRCFYHSWI